MNDTNQIAKNKSLETSRLHSVYQWPDGRDARGLDRYQSPSVDFSLWRNDGASGLYTVGREEQVDKSPEKAKARTIVQRFFTHLSLYRMTGAYVAVCSYVYLIIHAV